MRINLSNPHLYHLGYDDSRNQKENAGSGSVTPEANPLTQTIRMHALIVSE